MNAVRRLTVAVCGLIGLAATSTSAIEVSDFAAYSEGDVRIKGTVEGAIGSSAGDVRLQGDSVVTGDVLAAERVRASRRVVVTGMITPNMEPVQGLAPAAPGMPDLPSSLVRAASRGGGGPSYKGKYEELDLDPGVYGSLKVKGTKWGGNLHLTSGEYHFDEFTAKSIDFRFDVSRGPVTIFVDGKMNLSGVSVFVARQDGTFLSLEDAGPELAGLVYAEAQSLVKVSKSDWAGTLYTPDGKLLAKKSTIEGAVYSRKGIRLAGTALGYAPLDLLGFPDGPPDGQQDELGRDTTLLPEPATLALLGVALGGLLMSQRRPRSKGCAAASGDSDDAGAP